MNFKNTIFMVLFMGLGVSNPVKSEYSKTAVCSGLAFVSAAGTAAFMWNAYKNKCKNEDTLVTRQGFIEYTKMMAIKACKIKEAKFRNLDIDQGVAHVLRGTAVLFGAAVTGALYNAGKRLFGTEKKPQVLPVPVLPVFKTMDREQAALVIQRMYRGYLKTKRDAVSPLPQRGEDVQDPVTQPRGIVVGEEPKGVKSSVIQPSYHCAAEGLSDEEKRRLYEEYGDDDLL